MTRLVLDALAKVDGPCSRKQLAMAVFGSDGKAETDKVDNYLQRLKADDLVASTGKKAGKKPGTWVITDAGRKKLAVDEA